MALVHRKPDKREIRKPDVEFGFWMAAQIMRGQFFMGIALIVEKLRPADKAEPRMGKRVPFGAWFPDEQGAGWICR